MSPILEAQGLTYDYPGGVPALAGLDLRVPRGRRLAILGPNGSGKTTLLLHLNGTLRPKSGRVALDGQAVGYGRADLSGWRRRVGLVLQEADDQLFAASVAEDVSFGPLNMGLSEAETRSRVDEALTDMRIAGLAARPTHMLSFGQKKRAAIAGAVAMRPEILLLDEPTAGLDHHGLIHLLAALKRIETHGTTLVFTTHDVDLAYEVANDVALFAHGKVLAQGAAEAILSNGALLAEAHLRMPLVLELSLKARAAGVIPPEAPLPRSREGILQVIGSLW